MTGPLVLGLDGGGSKTDLIVVDKGAGVVAAARGIGLDPLEPV